MLRFELVSFRPRFAGIKMSGQKFFYNSSGPRMGMSQMNGNNRRATDYNRMQSNDKPVNNQHDDLIRYICDSWNKVSQEVDRNTGTSVIFYQEQENQNLKDFKPFDLEGFWGRRVVQNFQQAHNS